MLIIRVGLKSSVVAVHVRAGPGAQRALSLTARSRCQKRKDPAHAAGLSRGRKRKSGTGTAARKATPSPVLKGGHIQQETPGKK